MKKVILNSLESLKNLDVALTIKIGAITINKTERDLWSHFEPLSNEEKKAEFQRALDAQKKFRKLTDPKLGAVAKKYLVMSQIRYEKWREKKV